MRGWPLPEINMTSLLTIFQFTASCEADRRIWPSRRQGSTFNSQPHARLTIAPSSEYEKQNLSIHSLMRGWPTSRQNRRIIAILSIHSLMRGWPWLDFTVLDNGYLSIHSLMRGWPRTSARTSGYENLSIHSLMRGWPTPPEFNTNAFILSIHSLIRGWPRCSGAFRS